MSNSSLCHSPSPTPSLSTNHLKLPKFLYHHQSRDHLRSLNEGSSGASSSESSNLPPKQHRTLVHKSSHLFGVYEQDEKPQSQSPSSVNIHIPRTEEPVTPTDSLADPLIIIEPPSATASPGSYQGGVLIPCSQTQSEQPLSMSSSFCYSPHTLHIPMSPSSGCITDIPSWLTGWIQHVFTVSTTDLSMYSM